ncbi:NAD+ synthase/NAD+ synthase (glutamine-hydrolysing) [Verrucomicrobium sp. GAS474]|uniref:NAD+ synthase n=1 Tax=Verrucomicrobium sp. GAS474 TaxID=1882831 RepID=UPI000879ACB7|nr:NAD+ synthase [Verrucomicrobium sp. GAS474]SDU22499.1 NAD+ synthase/NAD+ synthase (glutamine-hydrolysing) [Verrucomicrobium sp. GAS474]
MKIGLLQLNSTIGDFSGNVSKLLEGYEKLVKEGADIVVTPELYLCGYASRDLFLRPDFIEATQLALRQVVKETAHGEASLCVGFAERNPVRPGRPLWNSVAWIHRGQIVQTIHKTLLPTYDVFDEDRYFEPAKSAALVRWQDRLIGVTICEDIWNDNDFWPEADRRYHYDPVRNLAVAGAQLILNLSASPWYAGKQTTRNAMLSRIAQDEGVPIVQVNLVGGNDELVFDGQSTVFDATGHLLHAAPSFAEATSTVDLSSPAPVETVTLSPEEKLYRAIALGLRDYVEKCGFKSVALGLSGGIDSAVVAALAVEALGKENVHGYSLPSRHSSPGSLDDARKLAENLGIPLHVVPIADSVETLEKTLGPLFQGKEADATEENIQARLRGVLLMALSNKFGHLILTTGNKSEISVGYCTLYGDMCGALAPIGDLWKTEVYALARWINREKEFIPAASITKPPSAELRPNQTDQDSLPDYAVLDAILQASLVDHKSRLELIDMGHAPELVDDILRKIRVSEYKRQQAAPVLKVSPRAFGTGRRIPIAHRFKG